MCVTKFNSLGEQSLDKQTSVIGPKILFTTTIECQNKYFSDTPSWCDIKLNSNNKSFMTEVCEVTLNYLGIVMMSTSL
ncbi:MAG: hypothetical protein ACK53Y_27090, partial [bacterium]